MNRHTQEPKIYIVTASLNGFDDTVELVSSLHDMDYKNWDLIIIDNGSENAEGQRLEKKYPEALVIRNKKNLGFAKAYNQGIQKALKSKDCKYILIINNDTTVTKDFLKPLINASKSTRDTICSPTILFYKTKNIQSSGLKLIPYLGGFINVNLNKRANEAKTIVSPDALNGCCIFANRETWEDVGLFNEDYFAYIEDVDWSFRAKDKGYKLAVLPTSCIYHKHSRATSSGKSGYSIFKKKNSPFKTYLLMRNNIFFAKGHLKGLKKISYLFMLIVQAFFSNLLIGGAIDFIPHYSRGIVDGFQNRLRLPQI